jgi:hypothetical protein
MMQIVIMLALAKVTSMILGNFVKMTNVVPGVLGRAIQNAGAPVAGTDAVQTLTITATGGTYKLSYDGYTTPALAYNALAATIQAALRALPSVGGAYVTVTGTGPWTITFSSNLGKKLVPVITVNTSLLTGGTASIANTTPGVSATARGAAVGAELMDTTNAKLYVNTGTPLAPTWTVVGTQT